MTDLFSKSSYTRHFVGELQDGVQCCIICGKVISDYTNVMVARGGSVPRGFEPGEVYVRDGNPRITTSFLLGDERAENCKA